MQYRVMLDEFLLELRLQNFSKRTIDTYRHNNNQFINWYYEVNDKYPEITDIKKAHIKSFIIYSLDKGRKASYINAILKGCRCFWNYVICEGVVEKSPMDGIKPLKVEKKVYVTFSDDEIRRILGVWNYDTFLSARNKAIISLMLDTGIRVSEVLKIRNEDLTGSVLKIHGKGNKWRMVPISSPLQYILIKYIRVRDSHFSKMRKRDGKERQSDDNLFLSKSGKALKTATNIELILKETGKRADVPLERVYPHNLRHYYASYSLLKDQDVFTISKILGHSNIKTTSTYIQSITDQQTLDKAVKTSPLNFL